MGRRFVIGDIHGCFRTLRILVEQELRPSPEDHIFFLGDYIDRGPNSKAVIDYIFSLHSTSGHVVPLMGNHEYMLNRALNSLEYFNLWMINSGFTTLKDFGVIPGSHYSTKSLLQIPQEYLKFFRDLKMYAQTEGFFLCHGCFEGNRDEPKGNTDSMIWGRKNLEQAPRIGDRILIHGHTPNPVSEIRKQIDDPISRVINLDAGCVYKENKSLGHLAALDLDSMELFIVKNSD